MEDGEIKGGGGNLSHISHIASGLQEAPYQDVLEMLRTKAHIPAHHHATSSLLDKMTPIRPAEVSHHVIRQVSINDAPYVILSKNLGIHGDLLPFKMALS